MNRRNILSLSATAVLGLALLPGSAIAQQKSLKEQLVGTWTFVSSTAKLANGSPAWGANPKGQLSLDADGRFFAIIVRSDLAKYASNNRMQTSPAEDKAGARSDCLLRNVHGERSRPILHPSRRWQFVPELERD